MSTNTNIKIIYKRVGESQLGRTSAAEHEPVYTNTNTQNTNTNKNVRKQSYKNE